MILPVPVKPWVKHLLKKQYGKEPFPIRSNSDIGSILLLAVSARDTLRLTVEDLTEENCEDIMPTTGISDISKKTEISEKYHVVSFLLGGKFQRGVIMADMLPLISNALEGYFKIFMKGYSIGYRTLINSELSSAVSFHKIYAFKEDSLKQDNLIKMVQRESKEMSDPLKGYYVPKRNSRI